MADPFDGVDLSDPCAVLPIVRKAYYTLLTGNSTTSVTFGDRHMTKTPSDLAALREEIRRLEIQCAQAQGEAPRRYAIKLGSRARITGDEEE